MSNTLTDYFGDASYKGFMKIASEVELPDFVKEASIDASELNAYGPDAFGDPAARRYPLNNRANTWVSREFFARDKDSYDPGRAAIIESRIQKAAELWELDTPKRRVKPETPSHVVEARHGDEKVFEVELTKPAHFKEAAENLMASKSKMTYDMRRSFARNLLATPDEFKCELPGEVSEYLEKAAGFGMATKASLTSGIMGRVVHVYRTRPDLSEGLVKMAHEVKSMDYTPTTLSKVAGMLDLVDRALDLHRYYDHGHATPEETVFAITEKTASDFTSEALRLSTGNVISKTALLNKRAIVDEFFENYMGEVPYDSDSEMVEVVTSLPRNDAAALESTAGLNGMTL